MLTPLVLLPGMMCDARLWVPLYAAFSASRAMLHMPLNQGDTPEAMAAGVLAIAPARFAVLGLSMGGPIAMELARQAPDRVDRMALLSTNHRAERPEVSALRPAQVARAQADLRSVMQTEFIPHYVPDGPKAGTIRDQCLQMALAAGPKAFAVQSHMLARRRDQTNTLQGFTGPALVLSGALDSLCPPDWHTDMAAALRHCRHVLLDGVGHLPVLEQPQETIAAVRQWLEQR